jgi:hypothetical protein
MGIAVGDYDNDGDFDFYVTNIWDRPEQNVLLRNDSPADGLLFTETAASAGVANCGWSWGTTFFDADLDGLLDVAVTNGWLTSTDASRFFLQSPAAPGTFVEVGAAVGFDDTLWGSALLAVDTDRDGRQDLIQTCVDGPVRVLRNLDPGATGHHLVVRPRMSGANHYAIGAVVKIDIGATSMMRPILAGSSFQGQEPAEAHFGLGAGLGGPTVVDRVRVEWPYGRVSEAYDVPVDQVFDIDDTMLVPACGGDVDGSAVVDLLDLLELAGAWGPCPGCAADFDFDDDVDIDDLLAVLSGWGACR